MKNIKFILLTFIIVFLSSCASDSSKKIDISPSEINKNTDSANIDDSTTTNVSDNGFEIGTTLFGAIFRYNLCPNWGCKNFSQVLLL